MDKSDRERFRDVAEQLAERIAAQTFDAHKSLFSKYETKLNKVKEYVTHHLRYLALAIEMEKPDFFGDYWAWNRSVLEGRKVPMEELRRFLPLFLKEVKAAIPRTMHTSVEAAIAKASEVMDLPSVTPPSFLDEEAALAPLAEQYLKLLLAADRERASTLILQSVDEGTRIVDIYLNVFQPVQQEIGRLWQTNEIGVAKEHYATAVTQLIMSQLYPRMFATKKNGKRMIAACVGKELHEIGVRMVADIFELSGWDTFYLGASTNVIALREAVDEHSPDILALSAASINMFDEVDVIIASLKKTFSDSIKILVGGFAFNMIPDMWQKVGADGFAVDGLKALNVAEELLFISGGE